MAQKTREQLLNLIRLELTKLAPENSTTVEEAVLNTETISAVFGMKPVTAENHDKCEKGHIRYHGVCRKCSPQEGEA